MQNTEILTTQEVAQYLKIPLSTVWYLIRNKKLPATRIGKHYRIKKKDLDRLLEAKQ